MKVKFIFAWYDLWMGFYWDRKNKWLYVFPIPMLGIILQFKKEEPKTAKEKFDELVEGKMSQIHQKNLDLLVYGVYYEDAQGNRVDPRDVQIRFNRNKEVEYYYYWVKDKETGVWSRVDLVERPKKTGNSG